MAFQSNIPQPTDQISVSQADILNNFIALSTFLNINHVDFASADQGKHKFVSFPVQAVAPVTTGTEVALYSKTSTLTGVPELFFRNATNGLEFEFTSYNPAVDGWVRTPAGILLKWGQVNGNGQTNITFPVAANTPPFTALYSIQLTTLGTVAIDPDKFVTLNGYGPTVFSVYCSTRTTVGASAVTFMYLAIGL